MDSSDLARIEDHFKTPFEMFHNVLKRFQNAVVAMNLATIDREFGILNRTVIFRGCINDTVTFVTERNSRKYDNIMENPKVALTLYFPGDSAVGAEETWQVRLFDAIAKELNPEEIQQLWQAETLHAQLRSHVCKCGEPVDPFELKTQHDQLLKSYPKGVDNLPQTASYTAFAVIANRWDFYKTEPFKIADRVQYRRKDLTDNVWQIMHVAA